MTNGPSWEFRWLLPVAGSAAVIAGALLPLPALRDAVTGEIPDGAQLVLPPGYVAFSPFSRLFDALGLLSTGQHVAVALTTVCIALVVASLRRGNGARSSMRIAASVAFWFGVLLVAYLGATILPRPMARLVVADTSAVVTDFHSHTKYSHDARRGFTVEANRDWHRNAGYNVGYISDHNSFTGAEIARQGNPLRAGDNTTLLSAFEGRYRNTFEIFLSLTAADSTVLMDSRRWLREGLPGSGRQLASVVALPSPLIDVQVAGRDGPPHIAAIEIVDGSPRGFAQHDRQGSEIIGRADSLGLALVSGSNDHGWGRVAPGWTLVSIPGWRELSPDSLAAMIELTIRAAPRTAVRVIERLRPTVAGLASVVTVPIVTAQTLRALTLPERIVWLAWIWGIALLWNARNRIISRKQPIERQVVS